MEVRGPDVIVDARRLLCPLPIIRAEAAIHTMDSGMVLAVRSTDPGLSRDLPAWCRIHGHTFLGIQNEGRELTGFVVKK